MSRAKNFVRRFFEKKRNKLLLHFLKKSPYEVFDKTKYDLFDKQNRLPTPTFDNLKLILAVYSLTRPDATFVQIGAYDGRTDDPASEYVLASRMKCLLVEPIEASFQK